LANTPGNPPSALPDGGSDGDNRSYGWDLPSCFGDNCQPEMPSCMTVCATAVAGAACAAAGAAASAACGGNFVPGVVVNLSCRVKATAVCTTICL